MALFSGFPDGTLPFLRELRENNEKAWFQANKGRYEAQVREPALAFIEAMVPGLAEISPHFRASPKKVGGSLMRIYRDVRFSNDKTPYKTNIGIQFRHAQGRDVHAPGFYLHIAPDECFVAAGIWHPESRVLAAIRGFLDDNPAAWRRALEADGFKGHFALAGDSLKRPPRGYSADHPLIDDLKRKDFIAVKSIEPAAIQGPELVPETLRAYRHSDDFMRYLCTAIGVNY
ncbi:MAG: DUF2461 domain-containing protein [Sedimenticola sp.]|nr:DUF2461 domain-containing protein [Sedimenticola sp.]